jgi:hypothetical protein
MAREEEVASTSLDVRARQSLFFLKKELDPNKQLAARVSASRVRAVPFNNPPRKMDLDSNVRPASRSRKVLGAQLFYFPLAILPELFSNPLALL